MYVQPSSIKILKANSMYFIRNDMLYYVIENGVLRELLLVVTNTPADKKHFFVKKTPNR